MDIIDRAQRLEEAERDNMIRKTVKTPDRAGTADCIDCEDIIPKARRDSVPHAMRCVDCESLHERGL